MDQNDPMDFQALRAKFQDEELLPKQPRIKPALPEKPKVVPPPQSPTHYLPAGARPSLLTSINQSLDGKTPLAPRVVFKDDKDNKKPLIQNNYKKLKSDGKLMSSKDKAEKTENDLLDQRKKDKKPPLLTLTQKERTAQLVPATPPPKSATQKKKRLLGFKKSVKRDSVEVSEPILDSPSLDCSGAAPLIPVPSDFIDSPKALLPNIPPIPDFDSTTEVTSPSDVQISPTFIPPPLLIPSFPSPDSETPPNVEPPALLCSLPDITMPETSAVQTTTPSPTSQQHEMLADACTEAAISASVESPVPPPTESPLRHPSPIMERPMSALSALERAGDMNPGKRITTDQRIINALQKARKKPTSSQSNYSRPYSVTPPPVDTPPTESPTLSQLTLPPIDYEGNAFQQKPSQFNGIDHSQHSPELEVNTENGSASVPELLVVPPPPPRKALPDPQSLGPAPEKPARPPLVNLNDFTPPSLVEGHEFSGPVEFSETDTTEFDDFGSLTRSPETPVSEWGNSDNSSQDNLDRQFDSNGTAAPEAEVHPPTDPGDEYQYNPQSLTVPDGAEAGSAAGLSVENSYEDFISGKKKSKSDGGKKRKGPPKNPYAEAAADASEEKGKLGRFTKSEKKVVVEGPDEKELKKREKQRLEKEKKELKEKQEREKKEQKEKEKRENEMKKKFNITGQEEAMYQAKVTVTNKGRKNDLPVNTGDIISIIRTTNCPKGKWLARDSSNNYGYVAVDHVELDIKEMLELGKKAAITRKASTGVTEGEVMSTGSRASNHFPLSAESFTDDSEEWTGDDEDNLSPVNDTTDPYNPVGHTRAVSMPDMGNKDLSIIHQHSHSDISADGSCVQPKHEALQKLATFFYSPKPSEPAPSNNGVETSPVLRKEGPIQSEGSERQEVEFENPDMIILPPPDLYADFGEE
ncbi:FYN-binding protein 1 [Cynoglossus semilaevis]|uniref:FYN binding protein 2 n=1 Tax=Cynoglossus semilaevis TaxID=244447 RepID=A0A3P8V0W4_CYNSE|nr:FYN-binding protein 2 [Cynoglossus semilaevis]XP_024909855.1 FYN-binding protein 2 [Cynoglossus semilaevis]